MVQKALKLFLLGLLLWPVFINLIGIISPFWGVFILNDNYGNRSGELLRFFQPYVPLVSILFAISLLLLGKVDGRNWMQIFCWIASLFYVGCSIYGFFPQDNVIYYVLSTSSIALETLMLFLGGVILHRIFGNLAISNGHPESAA